MKKIFITLHDPNNYSTEEYVAPDQIAHIQPYEYRHSLITLNSGKQTYVKESPQEVLELILLSDEELQLKVQAIVGNKELSIYQRRDQLFAIGLGFDRVMELVPYVDGLY